MNVKKVKEILGLKIKFEPKKFFKNAAKNKLLKKIGLYIGCVIVLLAILFVGFNLAYTDKIYPKVYIGETNFGGMKRDQASETLSKLIDESRGGKLYFTFDNKNYSAQISEFEVDYTGQKDKTINELMGVGRSGGLGKILSEELKSIFSRNVAYANFSFSDNKLSDFLKTIGADVDIPVKDATIEITEGKPKVVSEQIGREFNFDQNNDIAKKTIGSFAFQKPTAFIVRNINPQVLVAGAQKALAETERMLALKIVLKNKDKTFTITEKETAGLLSFQRDGANLKPIADPTKVNAYVDLIAGQVNQPAKDAKFSVESGKVVTFDTSQTGYELDKEQTANQIIQAYAQGPAEIELAVKVTEPKVSDDASTSGINELIGEGHTGWRGSPPNRIHNLTLGAEKISGTLVEPGQEFSTIHALAPITEANGYRRELVIKDGNRVEPDVGGGLCQVSTTLFRAVINSGLKVTQRTPHSFRVSYYEPPVGMDATVFDPAPDFRFINDYKTPILIWAVAGSNTLDFQIFGTKDGRKVEISDPVLFNYASPGGDVYTLSESMGAGDIRQVERATSGVTASFTYKVTSADGQVLENETYVSEYVPVPNTFMYGPGTEGIPGQEQQPPPGTSGSTPTPEPTATKKK